MGYMQIEQVIILCNHKAVKKTLGVVLLYHIQTNRIFLYVYYGILYFFIKPKTYMCKIKNYMINRPLVEKIHLQNTVPLLAPIFVLWDEVFVLPYKFMFPWV